MLPEKEFFKKYAQEKGIPWRERNVLLEYLQTQVLKALSLGSFNDKLSFLGGTCLRFVYGIDRFSEDLDFDLIKRRGFKLDLLQEELVKNLELQGFQVDARNKTTENIHIVFLKFRNVLLEFGIRAHREEKLLIKFEIDFDPCKKIETVTRLIDAYNDRFPIVANTLPTIYAQKIIAMKNRPYQKGRDFYDLIWFLAQKDLEPNYPLLREKGVPVSNKKEAVGALRKFIAKSDLKQAAREARPFLYYPEKAKWILDFPKYIEAL